MYLPIRRIIVLEVRIAVRITGPEINEITIISGKITKALFIFLAEGRRIINATHVGVVGWLVEGRHHYYYYIIIQPSE